MPFFDETTQSGVTISDLLFTSHQTNNQYLFPRILDLYLEKGSKIADLTYGKGVFWREVCEDDCLIDGCNLLIWDKNPPET